MPVYCIYSGGDGTQTNTTQSTTTLDWSKADTSVANLIAYDAAAFTTSGNVIYFADDHSDPNKAANWTLTGPTSGRPVILISADRTQSTPTFKVGTGVQLSSLGGAYAMTLDGGFAMYGIRSASGGNISFSSDDNESFVAENCTFAPGANGLVQQSAASGCAILRNCIIDLTADGTTNRSGNVVQLGTGATRFKINGLSFVNAGYRTGVVFSDLTNSGALEVYGADLSGFTNATACEILAAPATLLSCVISNCMTASTWTPISGSGGAARDVAECIFTNCGPIDEPTYLFAANYRGQVVSTASIYRTGGADVAGTPTSWLITTTASCGESAPFYTPWTYGRINSTGSRTFDCYITNDTADLTDAEAWLEVEYKDESGEAIWQLASDQRTITATAVAQTDDTTSTWTGTGPSFTYKQKLSVTATVNQTGQFRARVAIGKASIAGSGYLYVDPAVVVT